MATEWEEFPLFKLIDVKHGFAFPGENISDIPSDSILVTPGNFEIGGGFKVEKFKYFNGDVPEEYVLKAGDVVVTMTDLSKQADTLGYSALIPNRDNARFLHNQRIGKVIIKDDKAIDPRFLYYLLQTKGYRDEVLASATGTGVKHTAPSRILAYKAQIPDRSEQKVIAEKLKAIDDKIELNRKMNETLEAMARALFKSWFVDFDPVRANAEGRPTGLPNHIAALFPDSFEESEQRELPVGWTVENLTLFADLNPESWSRKGYPESIRYVDLSNTKWGKIESFTAFDRHTAPSRAQRILRPGDTIVGTVRPGNGSYTLISEDGLTGSTGFAVLRPMKKKYREFIYLAATDRDNIDQLAHLADGGAYPAIRPEAVSASQAVVPSHSGRDTLLEAFSYYTAHLLDQICHFDNQRKTLALIRDALLPKLISGEIRLQA